ncbi:MAG: hypothetical protein ACU0B9_14930 [Limimaricola soesokkakensis]|uniref:hypothetical protein n=1 Tax=Limimaricola soesokkakensis TaxID=1343159 RepID=UPI004058E5F9
MNDDTEHLGSGRTELKSSTAMPGQVATPPAAAPVWEDADPAMEQLDVEQMSRLEQATTPASGMADLAAVVDELQAAGVEHDAQNFWRRPPQLHSLGLG